MTLLPLAISFASICWGAFGLEVAPQQAGQANVEGQLGFVEDPFGSNLAPIRLNIQKLAIPIHPPAPPYPSHAKGQRLQSDVLFEVWVDKLGKPEKVFIIWGDDAFKETVVGYVMTWRFAPILKDGSPIPFRTRGVMPFRLSNGRAFQELPKGYIY